MVDYKDTIHLPRTKFPMKASLSKREPEFIEMWEREQVYNKLLDQTKDGQLFVFHDGPPYANGNIHHGHVLNKVLKDIVVKYRSLKGNHVRYIPGWDCHGLPIELNAERELGKPADDADKLSIRKRCLDFAMKWSNLQMAEFKRLGIFSLWDQSYRTIQPDYEATIVNALAKFVERGALYRGRKPVYWCTECQTALADAEVEYHDHVSPSIYVTYPVIDREKMHEVFGIDDNGSRLDVVIWTTTPWTLPASLVIAVHPRYNYRAYEAGGRRIIIAEDMAESTFRDAKIEGKPIGRIVPGAELEKLRCQHPFIEREIQILLADYVTLEAGTGCVHTAPGHGQEDYVLCAAHGIDVYAPVDAAGCFESDVSHWAGELVWDANPKIVRFLHESGVLLNPPGQELAHQYPACWRCKKPIVFRATPQWFISMEETGLRKKALEEIDKTRWIPPWGRNRIFGMVENRPDWCISRQRIWGVPLPFFFCEQCGESLVDASVIRHVAGIFGEFGSDEWWKREANDLLPDGVTCASCEATSFIKEENIVDVWFESGVSWDAVCRGKEGLGVPVDLYLEGSDQHRGWFHTALLCATGTMDRAPYKSVLTHGFICNEKGEILSKSQKNFVPPNKTIQKEGAEILRLWVSYEDYRSDIVFSPVIIKSLVESYRKIRNTLRFMLGNLAGFDPATEMVPFEEMAELDRWMLSRFGRFLSRIDRSYNDYNFHHVFHQTIELVTTNLSSFYCDIIKDRLYCDEYKSASRRAAQTVLYIMARDMSRVLAPVLSFTAEDVWQHLPLSADKPESVFLAGFPVPEESWEDDSLMTRWGELRELRRKVTKVLEELRRGGVIGNALEASVKLKVASATYEFVKSIGEESLADIFLVSEVAFEKGAGEDTVEASKSEQPKCPRCWRHGHGIGSNAEIPELCNRCAGVINQLVKDGKLNL
ncbi:MAG: isoleucine--tRNA ligase [Proteobacteria bacterium]|nr:isoleucine--tRNA ligase [Pseudomonadota bacterium]